MTRRPFAYIIPFVVLLGLMGGAVFLQHGMIDQFRKRPYQFRDALYLPSSEYIQAITLGYDHFAADFLWLRMIQSFAAGWTRPENAAQMKAYFDVVTDLDPKFLPVYSFSIMAVGEEGKRYDYVRSVVEKSAVKIPGNSKITYEGAFFANWNMNDPDLAKYYVRLAKLDPNYPEFIDRWEGYFDLQQGRYRAAYEKYLTDYVNALLQDNYQIFAILDRNMRRAIDSWFKTEIRSRAKAWQERTGKAPTIEELDQAGEFKGLEVPNMAAIEGLINTIKNTPPHQRKLSEQEIQQFVNGAVARFDHLPMAPYDAVWPADPGYVIWPHWKPDDELYVISKLQALNVMSRVVGSLNEAAAKWRDEHTGQCPPDIATFAPDNAKILDPFGDAWVWDPIECKAATVRYPNILNMYIPEEF